MLLPPLLHILPGSLHLLAQALLLLNLLALLQLFLLMTLLLLPSSHLHRLSLPCPPLSQGLRLALLIPPPDLLPLLLPAVLLGIQLRRTFHGPLLRLSLLLLRKPIQFPHPLVVRLLTPPHLAFHLLHLVIARPALGLFPRHQQPKLPLLQLQCAPGFLCALAKFFALITCARAASLLELLLLLLLLPHCHLPRLLLHPRQPLPHFLFVLPQGDCAIVLPHPRLRRPRRCLRDDRRRHQLPPLLGIGGDAEVLRGRREKLLLRIILLLLLILRVILFLLILIFICLFFIIPILHSAVTAMAIGLAIPRLILLIFPSFVLLLHFPLLRLLLLLRIFLHLLALVPG
mmetsp:Transcript_78585/g.168400  ORF Transcript_78585/g.168400 Transcript_78585/m.168400 type:complete len:344 (-) Transcript_78585:104-1135(-)